MSLHSPAHPKRLVSGSPALITRAKAISIESRLPRFGGHDAFFAGNSLPDWTNGVKDPQFTLLDLQKKMMSWKKLKVSVKNNRIHRQGKPRKKLGSMCSQVSIMALTI